MGTWTGSTTTNASGICMIGYSSIFSPGPGTYTIMVSYAGNVSYTASSGTSTLRIGIHAGGGTQTVVAADGEIQIVISGNAAIVFPEIATVTTVPAFNAAKQIGNCYDISVDNRGTATVDIILPYNPLDVIGRNQNGLRLYYWDGYQWIQASDIQAVDTQNHRVIARGVKHLSMFAIFSTAASHLEKVIVYPNPYVEGEHARITFGHPYEQGMQLTTNATIKVYNIAGELVATLEETNGDGILEWDATNDDHERLASGVYIYMVTNPQNERYIGKLAIIR